MPNITIPAGQYPFSYLGAQTITLSSLPWYTPANVRHIFGVSGNRASYISGNPGNNFGITQLVPAASGQPLAGYVLDLKLPIQVDGALLGLLPVTAGAPTITSFSPSSGVVGANVTITGTNFGASAGSTGTVKFNGLLSYPTAWNATSISVPVPTGATSGIITVTTSGGTVASATSFTVVGNSGGVPVFKIAGQSNAQGLARRSALYNIPLSTVSPAYNRQYVTQIWNPTANALQPLQVGTTADGTGNELGQQHPEAPGTYENGHGCEPGIAQALEQLGIVNGVIAKFGKGSTSIARWQKARGEFYPSLKSTIENSRAAIVASGKTPSEKLFYWDQWENDLGSSTYQADLTQLHSDLLADGLLTANELFAICSAQDANILAQQQAFVGATPNCVLVDPAPVNYIPNDSLHYESVTQLKQGNRLVNIALGTNITIDTTGTAPPVVDPTRLVSLRSWTAGNTPAKWSDETGNGNHLVQPDPSQQMQYVAAVKKGKAAYRVGPGTSFQIPPISNGASSYSIVYAIQSTKTNISFLADFAGDGVTGSRFVLVNSAQYDNGSYFNGSAFRGPAIGTTDFVIVVQTFDSTLAAGATTTATSAVKTYVNGTIFPLEMAGKNDYVPTALNGTAVLGHGIDGSSGFTGDIFALDIFAKVLSDAERNALVADLQMNLI